MKLITKFVLIYLAVTIIVLGIGGYLSFHIIKSEVDTELKWRFLDRVRRVTYLIEQGHTLNKKAKVNGRPAHNLTITPLAEPVTPRVEVSDTMVWHERLQQMEPNLKMDAYRNINGQAYHISTYGALIETDDIMEAVVQILLWILGMQIIGAIGVGFIVSNRLFKPFRKLLERIKKFNLQDKEPISAPKATVKEFKDLNRFVEEMTHKAVSDYKNLKEFAENASHELQTPLSIAKGKLELLTETDLTAEQYKYVASTQRSIKKLSRLSESLALLTKIENYEFTDTDEVNMTSLIRQSIHSFDEFIELNGLEVETNLEKNVTVQMHPLLADILWTNLFQNAIKHNIEEGRIHVELKKHKLTIANTGRKLETSPKQLFERFKKGEHGSDSIGLGLSIVKRISDQSNFKIDYSYQEGCHSITIYFNQS